MASLTTDEMEEILRKQIEKERKTWPNPRTKNVDDSLKTQRMSLISKGLNKGKGK